MNSLLFFYGFIIFFYSISLILLYCLLLIFSYRQQGEWSRWDNKQVRNLIDTADDIEGVSILAGCYNEENTIVDNINSLLTQNYPKFEVVIANDNSKDKSLERMIEAFDLVETPYDYTYKVPCKPFKRLFKSINPKYHNLTIIDKVGGGTKSDSINCCLNVIKYKYFINTDADCILSKNAIFECIFPVLCDRSIIAVSGVMSMNNGFTIKDNEIEEFKAPNNPIPLFQDLEYKRSFLIGKMGWSYINAMPNVSGGYGLFNTDICIAAGGYDPKSFAEDMDCLARMEAYCLDFNIPYKVIQIPHTCCWTEGPANLKTLNRQRTRWGRGLIQFIDKHKKMAFNRHYGRLGLITFPYEILFEFLAPIIEAVGLFVMIFLLFTGGINWQGFWVMLSMIYIFSMSLNAFVILYDYIVGGSYTKSRNYLKLILAALFEPFVYHPMITFFSLKGYFNYLINTKAIWGEMEHKGTKSDTNKGSTSQPTNA